MCVACHNSHKHKHRMFEETYHWEVRKSNFLADLILQVDLNLIEAAKEISVPAVIEAAFETYGPRPLVGSRYKAETLNDTYAFLTYSEVRQQAQKLGFALMELGVKPRDTVAFRTLILWYHTHYRSRC